MLQFKQIFKIDIINLFTNPMWVFYTAAFPLLLILILGFLTSGGHGSAVSSYDYYGITIMIYSALNAATLAANAFMEERIKSPNMRIVYSPVKLFYIYFSKVLATVVFTTILYTILGFVLHFTVGVNFGGRDAGFVWLLMVIVEFFAASLSVMICCLLKSESITNNIVSNLLALMCLLGGLFFPLSALGSTVEKVSYISPAKWILDAVLQLIYDRSFTIYIPTCMILGVLAVVCILISNKLFKAEDYI